MSPQPLVLIVDDVLENVQVLVAALKNRYRTCYATSGQAGLELVALEPPDLILLDLTMPEMGGHEVLANLKSNPATEHIPVIFVTGKIDAQEESDALLCGAVDFIHKPVNVDVVRARVGIHLELVRTRQSLEQRVAERTRELSMARDEVESALAVVTSLMNNASHEMRTPLQGILGFSRIGLGRLGKVSNETLSGYFEQILKSGLRMQQLVEALLSTVQASREENTALSEDEVKLIDGEQLIQACFEALGEKARHRGQKLMIDDQSGRAELVGDRERLRQVFDGLISNALEYSPENSTVCVRLLATQAKPSKVVIQVIDEGCGVPEKEQEAIFAPFYESSRTACGSGGTGLGLALCRSIVRRHKGSLKVRNRPEGGAIFEVCLPMEQCAEVFA